MDTYFENYVLSGGLLMVPIMICSIVLVASVIHLLFRLNRRRIIPPALAKQAAEIQSEADRAVFLAEAQKNTSALARAVVRAYREIGRRDEPTLTRGQVEPIVTESVAYVADDLYESTGTLATIYTISPLFGLLGTITGMMSAFSEYAKIQQKDDLTLLSAGIEEALITTMWGLIIAIPAYIAAHYFHSRIRRYEREDLTYRTGEILMHLLAVGPPARPEHAASAHQPRAHSAPESLIAPLKAQGQVKS